jgi:cytochrome P450
MLPKGPQGLPLIQLMKAIVQPLESLEANFRDYGDLYPIQFSGMGTIIVLSSPEAIAALMTAPAELFDSGAGNRLLQPFTGETSLMQLDGKPHQRRRKLLTPPFHGERLRSYGQAIGEIAQQVVEGWQPGQTLSIRAAMQEISLRVIMRTIFGIYDNQTAEQLRHDLNSLLSLFDRPINASFAFLPALQKDWGAWSPWGWLIRQREKIDAILYAEIQQRRANPDLLGDDILSLLLAARDEDGNPLTDQELRDELMTLLFAGHETTATALAWALYWTHRLPDVQANVHKELAELGENPDAIAISRLPYLSALCEETLRIYPVALFTFTRILKAPWTLLHYELEPGTQLTCCIYLLHHHPDVYADPKQFRPERFLERQFSPYEYIPFGGGSRRCLGMAFALFEMKLVLAKVLAHWHLDLVSDQPIRPVRRGFTLAPEKGVPMQVGTRR